LRLLQTDKRQFEDLVWLLDGVNGCIDHSAPSQQEPHEEHVSAVMRSSKFLNSLSRLFKLYTLSPQWVRIFCYIASLVSHDTISVFELNESLLTFVQEQERNKLE